MYAVRLQEISCRLQLCGQVCSLAWRYYVPYFLDCNLLLPLLLLLLLLLLFSCSLQAAPALLPKSQGTPQGLPQLTRLACAFGTTVTLPLMSLLTMLPAVFPLP